MTQQPLYGPEFGSYPAKDVAWLLSDLSHVSLEAPAEEREEAIQSGEAHYAESLPVEYQPSAAYQELFALALADTAEVMAEAVGIVTEMTLQLRGPTTVLCSLARAGTPIGVLMRRWAQEVYGLDLPHYALSIVRGRGIDQAALRFVAEHHDSRHVMFVDGWTGKGAITRELIASVTEANAVLTTAFSSQMAVLADTGRCVDVFGTREDFLIPSACLNSTVSGLVSRTVLNERIIEPGDFHGAKFYRELAGSDVSMAFIDAIVACFPLVRERVAQRAVDLLDEDRTPTWSGWASVEQISQEYGIRDVNLVKPGVGETTRVLLRRVPWKILVRSDRMGSLAHVLMLAEQRGVVVEKVDDLAYSCVGLIRPGYSQGQRGE